MTPDKVEEIVRQFKEEFISDRGYGEIPKYVPAQFDFSDYTDWVRTTLTQYHQDLMSEVEAREKQLRQIHTIELDTISCMSIEQFVVWRDQRKQRPTIIKSK